MVRSANVKPLRKMLGFAYQTKKREEGGSLYNFMKFLRLYYTNEISGSRNK